MSVVPESSVRSTEDSPYVPDKKIEADETSPLFNTSDAYQQSRPLDSAREDSQGSFDKHVIYFMTIHFLLAFCTIILVAPLIRLFENSLCLKHYGFPSGGVKESLCKIPDIQGSLATIRGWKSTLDTIPVLVVAIPLGRMADLWGRRKIFALSLIGVMMSLVEIFVVCAFPQIFPLRLVWLSSLFLLCGGGLNAASAYMWASASDSIPTERRSYAFYYIFSAFYSAEFVASFTASVTMSISPWVPAFLALLSLTVCLALLWLIPQPTKARSSTINFEEDARGSIKHSLVEDLKEAASVTNVLLAIPVFLVGIFRYTVLDVLIQYAANRFGLKISIGATFYTETAAINIALFLFIIPQVTRYLRTKMYVRPLVIDLFLVRTSVILMCLGSLSIGLSPSGKLLPLGVAIFAAGFGSRVSALSLVSYWIPDDAKATLYATITVLESIGHAIGDPSIQQLFAASLAFPVFWQAMPFFFAASLYFLTIVSTSFIHLDKGSRDAPSDGYIH
ncbi:major facilitator superfamily domain-containing protein [Calycina marina]|uniref:Major facilitator superfamily domain-containing protein n=1 Tax=Calycina marina TaxID=1763456 RepID=A0A9P7YW94_9HELO|nr:major facilitator superfamily domain-containing protein [Calycina marina]